MPNFIDLTGKKFGRLTVIKRAGYNKWKQILWLCKCECGKEKIIQRGNLRTGGTQSCGCLKKIKFGLASMRQAINYYKANARKRGYIFNLTEEQFAEITKRDCHYCEAKPNNTVRRLRGNGDYTYNGIDRIDNNKGYTMDNVVPCCKICNQAKHTLTMPEFKDWIKRVYKKIFITLS